MVVGLREGSSSADQAREGGLEVTSVADAASRGDIVMVLVPDELHHDVYENEIRDGIAEGNTLLFGHGFSVHYGEVEPPPGVDVGLVAPKGPGHLVLGTRDNSPVLLALALATMLWTTSGAIGVI